MLTITTPASDPNLLILADVKAALGIDPGDTSQDAALTSYINRASADIHSACRIKRGAGSKPTLRQETLTETIIFPGGRMFPLARRHEIELTSVTVNGSAQDLSACLVHSEAGLVEIYSGLRDSLWPKGKFVTVYKAGFATVPDDLAGIAMDLLKLYRSVESRDPLLRSERVDVDGVEEIERQYWVGAVGSSTASSPLPAEMMARLSPYRNTVIA
jgi:hypothetical protein